MGRGTTTRRLLLTNCDIDSATSVQWRNGKHRGGRGEIEGWAENKVCMAIRLITRRGLVSEVQARGD